MKKRARVVLFGLGLAAAAQLATAAGLETRQLSFSITYAMNTATGRYNHVYTGRCDVQTIGTSPYGLEGATGAQQGADNAARDKAVDPGRAMAAEMQKCGGDMNCARNVMMKAQSSGDLERLGAGITKASKVEANFKNWTIAPRGCSELTLSVDDNFKSTVVNDGEGGAQRYEVTQTVKGTRPLRANFAADSKFGIQHDLKAQVTEYRLGRPASPGFPTTRQGNAPAHLMTPGDSPVTIFPDAVAFPRLPGAPRSGRSVAPAAGGGTVTFEWSLSP